jgi:O-antigen/teichoic acid export membrane protein
VTELGATPAATSRARAARDVALQLAGRLASLVLGVVVTVVLVRALGVRDTGVWTTLLAINSIGLIIADLGLAQIAVREASAHPEDEPAWLGSLVVLRGALSIPVALVSVGAVALVTEGRGALLAGVLITMTVVLGTASALSAAFQIRVRNDRSTAIVLLNSVLWAVGVIVVALAGGGLVAFAAVLLGVGIATTALQTAWVLRVARVDLSGVRRHGREMLRVGTVVGLGLMLTIAYARIDQVLVLHYVGERGAGLYGTAYILLDRLAFVPAAVMATLYPVLASAWAADRARARRVLQQGIEYLLIAALPGLAFTIVAAGPLVRLLFGAEFAAAAPAVPVLMGAFVLICLNYLVSYAALVTERQAKLVWIASVTLVVNVVANVILLPHYGFEAAAWVTLASEALVLVLGTAMVLPVLGLRLAPGRVPRIVAAAAVMGLLVWAARSAGLGVVGLIAVAAIAYPAALLGLRAVDPRDLRMLRPGG